jgi:hypothetical protein
MLNIKRVRWFGFVLMLMFAAQPALAEQQDRLGASQGELDGDRDDEIETYLEEDQVFAAAHGGLFGFVAIQLNAWFPDITGDMQAGTSRINLDDDLGIDRADVVVLPVLTVNISRFGARIDGFFAKFDGSTSLDRALNFGGVDFQQGENVASEFKVSQVRALFLYSFINMDLFSLSGEVGVIGTRIEGTMDGRTSGDASRKEDIVLPAIGLLAEAKVLFFAFEAEMTGMSLGSGETVFDFRVAAAWSPLFFSLRVGYRYLLLDLESNGFAYDGTLSGFFIGVGFQF